MFKEIPGFGLYEMDKNKVIRHRKTKNIKSPHRGGDKVRLYTEEGKELSRKIDKLYYEVFPEDLPGVVLDPYTKYRILSCGSVYSTHEAKLLKPALTKDGYKVVSLRVGDTSESKSELVHRLVAKTYLERVVDKGHVNHKDGDKGNNNVDNLEWCSPHENMQHAYDNKLKIPLYKKCKITELGGNTVEFNSFEEASQYLGVTRGALSSTAARNSKNEVPSRGYGKTLGKYTCKGYIVEYNE